MAEEEKKQQASIKEKVHESSLAVQYGLERGDGKMWHRVLMACIIAFVGVFVIFGVFLDFMLEDQRERAATVPIVNAKENAVLPAGEYMIHRVMLDANDVPHYIVSAFSGGVIVSVVPSHGVELPDEAIPCLMADASTFTIRVDENGKWQIVPTDRYRTVKRQLDAASATEGNSENGGAVQ